MGFPFPGHSIYFYIYYFLIYNIFLYIYDKIIDMIGKDLIKGMIKPIVLQMLLNKERMYGYEITQSVLENTSGKISLTLGALYPVLHKLEAEGELSTSTEAVDNRLRKYYRLTKQGRRTALQKTGEMSDFIDALHQLWHQNQNNQP